MSLPRFHEDSYGHFVTTKTYQGQQLFNDTKVCEVVLANLEFYRQQLHFDVLAYCLMPDHFHLIVWWDMDEHPGLTISTIMHRIKGRSAKQISDYLFTTGKSLKYFKGRRGFHAPQIAEHILHSRGIKASATPVKGKNTRDALPIWQPYFYDFNIHSDHKLHQKIEYIHQNPVTAGLCKKPEDWPWSSYRQVELEEPSKQVQVTTW